MAQTLYAITGSGGALSKLCVVNPLTAEIEYVIGSTGMNHIASLAFKSDGTLYGVSNDTHELVTISLVDGSATVIGNIGTTDQISHLAFSRGGTWGSTDVLYGARGRYIATFDLGTGVATTVSDQSPVSGGSYSIAFNSAGDLFWKPSNHLYSISPSFVWSARLSYIDPASNWDNVLIFDEFDVFHIMKRVGFSPGQPSANLYTLSAIYYPNIFSATRDAILVGNIPIPSLGSLAFFFGTPPPPPPPPPPPTLYAITGAGDTPSTLYTVDPADGSWSGTVGSTGMDHIASFAVNSGGTLYGVNNNTHQLVTISTVDGSATVVGSIGAAENYSGLAFSRGGVWGSTDVLYGVRASPKGIATFNLSNGLATIVDTGFPGTAGCTGVSFDSTGALYIKNCSQLYSISPSFVYTLLCTYSGFGGSPDNPFAFDETDIAYHVQRDNLSLYTVNTGTGAGTLVGNIGANNIGGIAFVTNTGPPPGPQAEFASKIPVVPVVGVKGTVVQIRGTYLTDITDITFDDVATTFNIISDNLIVAVIPTAAETGFLILTDSHSRNTTMLYNVFTVTPSGQTGAYNLAAPPGRVNDLTATAYVSPQRITLNWTALPGATTYGVYRSTTPGTEIIYASGIVGTTYDDTVLANIPFYYYVIRGVGPFGVGPFSNETSATPIFPPVLNSVNPEPPGVGGDAKICWTAPYAAVTSYDVYRDGVFVANTAGPCYIDTAGADYNAYDYTIRANGAYGSTAQSSIVRGNNGTYDVSFTSTTSPTTYAITVGTNDVIAIWYRLPCGPGSPWNGSTITGTWDGHALTSTHGVLWYKNTGPITTGDVVLTTDNTMPVIAHTHVIKGLIDGTTGAVGNPPAGSDETWIAGTSICESINSVLMWMMEWNSSSGNPGTWYGVNPNYGVEIVPFPGDQSTGRNAYYASFGGNELNGFIYPFTPTSFGTTQVGIEFLSGAYNINLGVPLPPSGGSNYSYSAGMWFPITGPALGIYQPKPDYPCGTYNNFPGTTPGCCATCLVVEFH